MMRRAIALVASVTWCSQAAAEPAAQEMMGTWAKDGKSSFPSERLVVTPTTVRMGEGRPAEIAFYTHEVSGRQSLRWKAQGEAAHLQYIEPPQDTLAFYGLGWGMGGPTAIYRRCP
ncbi:MAG: hypothetical protein FD144_297 [Rhodospirillaceae bacterium]|nr:MAG: hypothetical protein FD144_297 [Rhodospirillaceae bacterium]